MTQLELFPEDLEEARSEDLPDGWAWATLQEISETIYRYPTFYGMEHLNEGIPVIRGEHIHKDGTISHDWSDYWFVSPEISSHFPRTVVQLDDIIMSVRGSVGKVGLVDNQLIGAQVSPNCIRIALNTSACDPKYALYYLKSTSGGNAIQENTNATTIQTIKASLLNQTLFPLAPLPEQQRIVEAIESLFTQLDVGVGALKRLRANLRRYKAAVLKAACEGKLVPQDPDDEPASDLLERILVERRAKWEAEQLAKGKDPRKLKYDEPVAPDTSDLPELPEGWVWASPDQISVKITDGTHSTPIYVDVGIPFLSVNNMSEDGGISFANCKFISISEHEALYKRCNPEKGDILLSKVGTVGLTAVIRTDELFSLFVNAALIKPLHNMVNVDYIAKALRYGFNQNLYQQFISGSTQKFIGLGKISLLPFPLPSLAEQARIVNEYDACLSLITALEFDVEHSLKRSERLRQAILKQAFEGKLVPQDPNDEPVSVLLEHIKQGRESQPRKKIK